MKCDRPLPDADGKRPEMARSWLPAGTTPVPADRICGEVDLEMNSAAALAPPRCLPPDPACGVFPHVNRHVHGLLGWLDGGRAECSTADFSKSNVGFCPNDFIGAALPRRDQSGTPSNPRAASEMLHAIKCDSPSLVAGRGQGMADSEQPQHRKARSDARSHGRGGRLQLR
jgi:hypothetical protein